MTFIVNQRALEETKRWKDHRNWWQKYWIMASLCKRRKSTGQVQKTPQGFSCLGNSDENVSIDRPCDLPRTSKTAPLAGNCLIRTLSDRRIRFTIYHSDLTLNWRTRRTFSMTIVSRSESMMTFLRTIPFSSLYINIVNVSLLFTVVMCASPTNAKKVWLTGFYQLSCSALILDPCLVRKFSNTKV